MHTWAAAPRYSGLRGVGVERVVGDARVRLGYVLCDVVAKFLPASIYVSLAVDP